VLRLAVQLAEPAHQLVVVAEEPSRQAFLDAAAGWYRPGALVVAASPGTAAELAAEGVEVLADRAPGASLCTDFVCLLPVREPAALGARLGG